MPDDDTMLGQNLVDVRNEGRRWRNEDHADDWRDEARDAARDERRLQLPACDHCSQGAMDATNSHYLGLCECECHEEHD